MVKLSKKTKGSKVSREYRLKYAGGLTAKAFREYLRKYSRQGQDRFEEAIGAVRQRVHHSRYEEVVRAALTVAPGSVPQLFPLGKRSYGDLLRGRPFPVVPLDSELRWTATWLSLSNRGLREFREVAREIQELVGKGDLRRALTRLDGFRTRHGWSLWAAELQTALTQLHEGTPAQKQFTSSLRKQAPRTSIAAFLAYLVGDRNDDSLSYDSFYTKNKETIPKIKVEQWVQDHLLYRALQHYEATPDAIASNLRNERLSSGIDLYETFIESALAVCTNFHLRQYRPAVLAALDSLDGSFDYRQRRLAELAGQPAHWSSADEITTLKEWGAEISVMLWQEPDGRRSETSLRSSIHTDLSEIWNRGSAADKAVPRMLKLGLNLKPLDIGLSIAGHVSRQSGTADRLVLLAPNALLLRDQPSWEEAIGGPIDLSVDALQSLVTANGRGSDVAQTLLASISGDLLDLDGIPSLGLLWLSHYFDLHGRKEAADSVTTALAKRGGRWSREATRQRFVSAYSRNDLLSACAALADTLTASSDVFVELPISDMFEARKWADFAKIDPIHVGLAAHFATDVPLTSPVNFISSQACRAVNKNGTRALLNSPPPNSLSTARQKQIVLFFTEVWTEDKLGRTGLFASSHEVRIERIRVLQNLIAWDPTNEKEYVTLIKALTVNETLWQGLKHLNETRVFVNELGITRWAERELVEDYQRWLALSGSTEAGEVITEEKLLQYMSAPMDSHASVQSVEELTEADGALLSAVNRLLQRFLADPTDGLNCYLSLRVRHGTMAGTLFSPGEAADLLVPADEPKEDALIRLRTAYNVDEDLLERVYLALSAFTLKQAALTEDLIKNRIQIWSDEKPNGLIYTTLNFRGLPPNFRNVAKLGFHYFVQVCYAAFWQGMGGSLEAAKRLFENDVKRDIDQMFAALLDELEDVGDRLSRLMASIKTTATLTTAQCDIVGAWFQLPNLRSVQAFTLDQAIEIAQNATKNVYPGFDPDLEVVTLDSGDLQLSGVGLSAIADCIFIMLQNVFKRADVGRQPPVRLKVALIGDLLTLEALNPVSDAVRHELEAGKLADLKRTYANPEEALRLAATEGRSGMPKLWRLSRAVEDAKGDEPFDFGLTEDGWWRVKVTMRLLEQNGVHHAL